MARNPHSDILLYENPYYGAPASNPRHRRRRRNPNLMGGLKKVGGTMFGGLNVMEVLGAVGGFALCAMVPGYIIKTVDTNWKKVGKLAISVAFAVAGKAALHKWNPGVAKAVMYGGIAGAGALGLKMWSPGTNLINAPARRIGPSNVVPRAVPTPGNPPNMGRSTNEEFVPANLL